MSTIVIVGLSSPSLGELRVLRGATRQSFSELRARLETATPLFQRELFLNDHDEVRDAALAMLRLNMELCIYEIQPAEAFDPTRHAVHQISREVLKRILVAD